MSAHATIGTLTRPGGSFIGAILLAVVLAACTSTAPTARSARAVPKAQQTKAPIYLHRTGTVWGIHSTSRGSLTPNQVTATLEQEIGGQFSGIRIYTNIGQDLPTAGDQFAARNGLLDYHGINSWTGARTCVSWADVAAGREDAWFTRQADAIRTWGYPIFLAFNHEPTVHNPHHPQCGTAAQYRAAFDHLVGLFAARGVHNVTWVWTLTAPTFDGSFEGPTAWEPAHFDVVGVDGYNRAKDWQRPEAIFGSAERFARSQGKPLLIGEIGCDERPGNPAAKATWITEAARMIKAWGNVKAVLWSNTATARGDYWLDSSPQSLAAVKKAIHNPYFI